MRNPLSRRPAATTEPADPEAGAALASGPPADRVPAPAEPAAPYSTVGFSAYLRYFLGLGTWGFGGPIASVGYMQRDLVERRGWLTEADFIDGVALGQTMPGPLAACTCRRRGKPAHGDQHRSQPATSNTSRGSTAIRSRSECVR